MVGAEGGIGRYLSDLNILNSSGWRLGCTLHGIVQKGFDVLPVLPNYWLDAGNTSRQLFETAIRFFNI